MARKMSLEDRGMKRTVGTRELESRLSKNLTINPFESKIDYM